MNHENAARIDQPRLTTHEHEIARAETRPPGRNSRPESEIRPNDAASRIARARSAARRPEPDFGAVGLCLERGGKTVGQAGIDTPFRAPPFHPGPLPDPSLPPRLFAPNQYCR